MFLKYYCVTFDISPSTGRNADYATARRIIEALVGTQNYFRLMMQCCVVRTDQSAADLRDSIKSRLAPGINILVMRLAPGFAFKISDPQMRRTAGNLLREIDTIVIK
jgi:hypothetical protein